MYVQPFTYEMGQINDRPGPNQGKTLVAEDFFTYQEDFLSLAASTSANGTINIQADSDFLVQKLTFSAFETGGDPIPNPQVTVQITDSGSGRNILESPVPIASLFGTGELPFILPTPKLFVQRATINVAVANFGSSEIGSLRLSFVGKKLFYAQG